MAISDEVMKRSSFAVPAEIASEIWSKTLENSVAMALATKIELPADGKEFPIITGDAEPDWVAEGAAKPVSGFDFSRKTLKPYKLAVITPFSDEFRRDRNALYSAVIDRIPLLLAKKFDKAVFSYDADDVPGEKFDNFAGIDDIDLEAANTTLYGQLVAADTAINVAGYVSNGYAITPQLRGKLLGVEDGVGHPLFNPSVTDDGYATLLGQKVYMSKYGNLYSDYEDTDNNKIISTLGIVGDWSQALYGTVEGVKLDITDTATLGTGDSAINLWQQNMFAVRAEIELGFGIKDKDAFQRLVTLSDPS